MIFHRPSGTGVSFVLILLALVGPQCRQRTSGFETGNLPEPVPVDLREIKSRGRIIGLTDYNSTDYFIYRGEPMGFQYELLKELAVYLELDLEIIAESDLDVAFNDLQTGRCDLIALNLTVTRDRSRFLAFTLPTGQTRQVLVQRKPRNWRSLHPAELNSMLIRNQLDLAGKTVYVQKNSAFSERLHNLSEEIGDSIHIIEVPEEMETLISLVAKGEIDYTVCDEIIGKVNQTYYPNLDIETAVSFPQNLAWSVRKNAGSLLEEVNAWLEGFKPTLGYALIYNKYFRNLKTASMVQSDLFTIESGKISPWDDEIRTYSSLIGWDWRLLASLMYQESRFDPTVESWAGAYGLMQLMPSTAKRYGVSPESPPEKNIEAGVLFIQWLDGIFADKVKNPRERIKFILAAYNVGAGHILDARRLAEKYGKNPELWEDHVEYFLLKKAEPRYFRDPVVEYGYCRGEETYHFVQEIMDRYEHYKNILVEG